MAPDPNAQPRSARTALAVWIVGGVALLAFEAWRRVDLAPWPYYRGWNWTHEDSGPFAPDDAPGPFFANARYEGECYGDLAFVSHVPELRRERPQVFSTDGYGYRNPPGRELGPWHVLALGDSMMAGAGLSDSETLPAVLEELLGREVYNAAGPAFGDVVREERLRAAPPRFVLLQSIERYVVASASTMALVRGGVPASGAVARVPPALTAPARPFTRERFSSAFSAATHYGALLASTLHWRLLGSLETPDCFVGTDGRTLFSIEEIGHRSAPPEQLGIEHSIAAVAVLRDWFAAQGSQVVYVLVPDKATVYPELVPGRFDSRLRPPSSFVDAMHARLEALGVPYVDLHSAFVADRAAGGEPLYWPDDTHWSPHGVRVAARATAERLRELER